MGSITAESCLERLLCNQLKPERLSIDITGPHSKSTRWNMWIRTTIDPYTKWVEAIQLRNKEAETVARVHLEQVLMQFGTPIAMFSDRGNEVDSVIMRAVGDLLDIDKMHTTSYRPPTYTRKNDG